MAASDDSLYDGAGVGLRFQSSLAFDGLVINCELSVSAARTEQRVSDISGFAHGGIKGDSYAWLAARVGGTVSSKQQEITAAWRTPFRCTADYWRS